MMSPLSTPSLGHSLNGFQCGPVSGLETVCDSRGEGYDSPDILIWWSNCERVTDDRDFRKRRKLEQNFHPILSRLTTLRPVRSTTETYRQNSGFRKFTNLLVSYLPQEIPTLKCKSIDLSKFRLSV